MESKKQIIKPLKRIKTTRQEIYYQNCPVCDKEISGKGVKTFRRNLERHMKSKHSNKEEVQK